MNVTSKELKLINLFHLLICTNVYFTITFNYNDYSILKTICLLHPVLSPSFCHFFAELGVVHQQKLAKEVN